MGQRPSPNVPHPFTKNLSLRPSIPPPRSTMATSGFATSGGRGRKWQCGLSCTLPLWGWGGGRSSGAASATFCCLGEGGGSGGGAPLALERSMMHKYLSPLPRYTQDVLPSLQHISFKSKPHLVQRDLVPSKCPQDAQVLLDHGRDCTAEGKWPCVTPVKLGSFVGEACWWASLPKLGCPGGRGC